jgi:hypothetical protein
MELCVDIALFDIFLWDFQAVPAAMSFTQRSQRIFSLRPVA